MLKSGAFMAILPCMAEKELGEDSPTQFDASAIKTFALNGQSQREVTTEYFPTDKLTKVTNRVYSLTKLTNPGAIIRINTASAD